jgi:hypothetical protein
MLHDEVIVDGMLIVIAVITLTFAYRNLRRHLHRSPASPRRPVAVAGPRAGATAWVSPPPRTPPSYPEPGDDYPGWPGGPDPRWTALEEAWAADGRG